jgi:hypothetical protein
MAYDVKNDDNLLAEIQWRLQDAVAHQNYREAARLAKMADEETARLEQERLIAESRKNAFASLKPRKISEVSIIPNQNLKQDGEPSPRERGNRVRAQYIENVLGTAGIRLTRLNTKKYRTATGFLVGFCYASELEIRPDSWFLGLADEQFDFIVLLCESKSDVIAAFVLPSEFVKRVWETLSRSNGQVKFHVTRTGSRYYLRIPGAHLLEITEYLNNMKALKEA